ncbi:hypothetical protein C2E23DRAFT_560588 [Lenzites betulinus]|nr:hypothetical protein C2E23DRAFT_560588 [Lenzites betulinus]
MLLIGAPTSRSCRDLARGVRVSPFRLSGVLLELLTAWGAARVSATSARWAFSTSRFIVQRVGWGACCASSGDGDCSGRSWRFGIYLSLLALRSRVEVTCGWCMASRARCRSRVLGGMITGSFKEVRTSTLARRVSKRLISAAPQSSCTDVLALVRHTATCGYANVHTPLALLTRQRSLVQLTSPSATVTAPIPVLGRVRCC